ncbi:AraC family transcriptional regulator [uncultured Vagococcus sp.]|uniref:AraC family transcriptional regulator n=1 Tax=uncultured Vagococcus sp. TaxID=189676 RepID=UPI0028CFE575|nr:helix-turn-helix domain-containing protein [uncultured Vagococcus sp.]
MCNILMVTSDSELKRKLVNLLNKYFVNVFILPHAKTGADALAIAKNHQPEIIMLDLNLKNENAYSYQRDLLASYPNLRSIVIDNQENCKNAQTAIRFGAIDYLVQPLIESEALSSIHRAIISLNQVSLLDHRSVDALPTQNETILPMIQYIHSNYQQELNLNSLADFMHLNKNYICQLFKKEVGMTYITYLNQYRVEQSKLLLRNSDKQLAEISEKVGYTDPTYFSRIFKKITDISPNQYRQTYKGDFIPVDLQQVF